MPAAHGPPLPVGPLVAYFGRDIQRLAHLGRVDRRTVHRWLATGSVPERFADRVAINGGAHPALIWPDIW